MTFIPLHADPAHVGESTAVDGRGTASSRSPSFVGLLRRSGLPLIMLCIVVGTLFWGGYATLVLAVIAWRLAGVLL